MSLFQTATGKVFETDFYVESSGSGRAYFRVLKKSLIQVVTTFSDPVETNTLVFAAKTFTGYNKLMSVMVEDDGIQVCLGKE